MIGFVINNIYLLREIYLFTYIDKCLRMLFKDRGFEIVGLIHLNADAILLNLCPLFVTFCGTVHHYFRRTITGDSL